MLKGHIEEIKKINRERILETIIQHQPISRSDIAKVLSISRSTASAIVNEFVEKEIIVELQHGNSTKEGGRRGMQVGLNPHSAYIIGIVLNKSSIKGCLTDLAGTIIFESTAHVHTEITEESLTNFIHSLVDQASIPTNKILAISCSVPGIVDSLQGIVINAPEITWTHIPLRDWLQKAFHCTVFINNNVNCLAIAEKWNGSAKNSKNYIYIYVGKGIGSGIIANDQLIIGNSFSAGEMGYFAFPNDSLPPKHEYGEYGTFDKKVSILSFPENMHEEIQHATYQNLNDSQQETFDQIINYLGFSIGNIISLLNPEKVIIGGELKGLIQSKEDELTGLISKVTPIPFKVTFSQLNRQSEALGSVSIAIGRVAGLLVDGGIVRE